MTIDKTALKITEKPIWREVLNGDTLAGNNQTQFTLEPHRFKVFAVIMSKSTNKPSSENSP